MRLTMVKLHLDDGAHEPISGAVLPHDGADNSFREPLPLGNGVDRVTRYIDAQERRHELLCLSHDLSRISSMSKEHAEAKHALDRASHTLMRIADEDALTAFALKADWFNRFATDRPSEKAELKRRYENLSTEAELLYRSVIELMRTASPPIRRMPKHIAFLFSTAIAKIEGVADNLGAVDATSLSKLSGIVKAELGEYLFESANRENRVTRSYALRGDIRNAGKRTYLGDIRHSGLQFSGKITALRSNPSISHAQYREVLKLGNIAEMRLLEGRARLATMPTRTEQTRRLLLPDLAQIEIWRRDFISQVRSQRRLRETKARYAEAAEIPTPLVKSEAAATGSPSRSSPISDIGRESSVEPDSVLDRALLTQIESLALSSHRPTRAEGHVARRLLEIDLLPPIGVNKILRDGNRTLTEYDVETAKVIFEVTVALRGKYAQMERRTRRKYNPLMKDQVLVVRPEFNPDEAATIRKLRPVGNDAGMMQTFVTTEDQLDDLAFALYQKHKKDLMYR